MFPDFRAGRRCIRGLPEFEQIEKFLCGGQPDLLSGFSIGLIELAPFGPLVLNLIGRHKLCRAHARRDNPVVDAGRNTHLGRSGEYAIAKDLALGGTGEDFDADLQPGVMNQFKHVGLLGLFPGGFDHDFHASSIGEQADIVTVTLGQAQPVK